MAGIEECAPGPARSHPEVEDAAIHIEGRGCQSVSVSLLTGAQQRQRVVFREQPLCTTASTQSKEREATHGRGPGRWRRVPRVADLCKLLALIIGLMIVFHSASCGYFFCTRFPGVLDYPRDIYDDLRDIHILRGGPRFMSRGNVEVDESPKLIPKLIHQTYKSSDVPKSVRPFMQSWRRLNEDWEIRFYDDEACFNFVKREFPEYYDAYRALPKHVERSDFFRYMVVLRLGGVYADIDTECRQPLNGVLRARDTLVVSWENEFESAEEANRRKYVRKRQVLQWVFAGAPGHPALREICDHIARNARATYSDNTNVDTLEKTGPGIWTDVVLKHARLHPPANKDDPWSVRVLPKVFFGAHPLGLDGLAPDDPGIVVMHHFYGSWKVRGGWGRGLFLDKLVNLIFPGAVKHVHTGTSLDPSGEEMEEALPHEVKSVRGLYPVDIQWKPGFTMLVNLVGHGDPQAGVDVSATLTAWGKWQPAVSPMRGPTVADALVGSLGGRGAERRVLLDVGAGLGYFSLAAAARGQRVIAFELAPQSLEAFRASVAYNGFGKLIQIHEVALGADDLPICVDAGAESRIEVARGYAHPAVHALSSETAACGRYARRRAGSDFVPDDVEVGAVRISATGWEGWVIEGLKEVVRRHPPGVILVELHPTAMEGTGYMGGALRLLQDLYSWGYTDVSHSGSVCDERWHNITGKFRMRKGLGVSADLFKQPTWCRLAPSNFPALVQRASPKFPENILFTFRESVPSAAAVPSRVAVLAESPSPAHTATSAAPTVASAAPVLARLNDTLLNSGSVKAARRFFARD